MSVVGLIGVGGFAREVLPFLERKIENLEQLNLETLLIVDDDYLAKVTLSGELRRYSLIGLTDFLKLQERSKLFAIAIADIPTRYRIANLLLAGGCSPISLVGEHSIIYNEDLVREGSIICSNAIVSSDTSVGSFFQLGFGSYLAHDCQVGNFVTVGPNSTVCGNVLIEDCVQLGAGVVIKPGTFDNPIRIGSNSVIGAGSIVTKNVEPGSVVVGNPARKIL